MWGIGNFDPGDHIRIDNIDLRAGFNNFAVLLGTPLNGGIEVRSGSPSGPLLDTVDYSSTGGWSTEGWFGGIQLLAKASASQSTYLVGTGGSANLFEIWFGNE